MSGFQAGEIPIGGAWEGDVDDFAVYTGGGTGDHRPLVTEALVNVATAWLGLGRTVEEAVWPVDPWPVVRRRPFDRAVDDHPRR